MNDKDTEDATAEDTAAGKRERILLLPDGTRLGASRIMMLSVRPPYRTDPDFTELAIYHEEDRDGHDFHDYEVDIPVVIGAQVVASISKWLKDENSSEMLDLSDLLERLDADTLPNDQDVPLKRSAIDAPQS